MRQNIYQVLGHGAGDRSQGDQIRRHRSFRLRPSPRGQGIVNLVSFIRQLEDDERRSHQL